MALANKVHKDKNLKTWKVMLIEYLVEPYAKNNVKKTKTENVQK